MKAKAVRLHAAYHTQMGVYTHEMGIKEGGKLAIMAGAGLEEPQILIPGGSLFASTKAVSQYGKITAGFEV